ncbi:MAG TPA: 2-aminoethylphosphonate--pyruvate transaminase [Terriglobia bacterium]|nr:2-aminoethylphosphonate--pyruvate transaminase [Terriglobia bacterium]
MEKDKLLFTPGPLTTSESVKRAMLRDLGSRDREFVEMVRKIRRRLLELGKVADGSYTAVLMQGSGTFAVESVISTVLPRDGKLLVLLNGAYGHRMAKIARTLGIATETLFFPESRQVDPEETRQALRRDPAITHVGTIHCETSTGIMNPVEEISRVVKEHGRVFLLDAMSSFGAVPVSLADSGIDFLVSSANKCIQGVPGFGFVLARQDLLLEAENRARSLSLDLVSQWKGLESDGQFRFTPPTQVLLAFWQALQELDKEGGIAGRAARYAANQKVLLEGMKELGFDAYLAPEHQSYIITSFRYPKHPNFEFSRFYQHLSQKGFVIYPGKVSEAECFRIGTIGHICPEDLRALVAAVRQTLEDMQIRMR